MKIIVKKFGGTSVSNIDKMIRAGNYIKDSLNQGNKLVAVVSAMGDGTDKLISILDKLEKPFSREEYDSLLSTGEQASSAIFSIVLKSLGIEAQSLLGWQVPIKTIGEHSKSKIKNIQTSNIQKLLDKSIVPVIAGFQGVNINNRITTLGRGGSDTTAVAIAAALKAYQCDIYTDVNGVFTADPRIVKNARKLNKINFEEMLELSSLGTKVLQSRSVQLAYKYDVRLQVLSSLHGKKGTMVVKENEILESNIVSGIAHSCEESRVTITGLENKPGISAKLFTLLANENINVDMIVQSGAEKDKNVSFTFTIPKEDTIKVEELLSNLKSEVEYARIDIDKEICKVSVVGLGMKSHVGVANKMFSILAKNNINIHVISTSEIKISVLIDAKYKELAIRSLHEGFNLES